MNKMWMKCISYVMIVTLCVTLWSPVGMDKVSATEASVGMEYDISNDQTASGDAEDNDEGDDDVASGDATEEVYSIVLVETVDQEEKEIESIPALDGGDNYQLNPRLKKGEDEYIDNVEFTFSSSDEDVVSVSETGMLEAKELPEKTSVDITITCKNPDDDTVITMVYSVEVNATVKEIPVTEVAIEEESKTLIINHSYTIKVQVLPSEASQEVIYKSSNEDIAKVENGVVTALKEGDVTITVTSVADETKTDQIKIEVIDIPVALEFDSPTYSLKATDSLMLGLRLKYASGKIEPADASKLSFTSDNTTIATVDGAGKVTTLEQASYPQATVIRAVYDFPYVVDGKELTKQLSAECQVTVTAIPVEAVQLQNNVSAVTLEINDTYTLLPEVIPGNATNPELTFSSSATSVATVSSAGVITAKSIGEAVITVASKENPAINATFAVKVYQTIFNVAELGADGTDSKVDNKAINKVLKYASHELLQDQMITVTIPDGTYYISDILTIYSNTNLVLADNAIIQRKASAGGKAMLRTAINSNIGGYDQCKNITITGGVWDGNANGKKDADCIYIGHAQNVIISNTTVKNNSGAHLIELAGVKNAIIENVELYGYTICKEKGYTASQADKEAIQLDYCSSNSTPAMKPHDLTPCENVTIRNCDIHDYMSGIGSHGSTANVYLQNIRIENNKFTNITNSCVNLLNFKNVTIKDNKASGFTTFLYASGSEGTVTNNDIKNTSFTKKTSSGLRAANGITVSNKSKFTITKNKIQKVTSNGITVWNGSTATIKSNTIKSNNLYGIRTQGSTITLAKNKISKNKKGLYDTYKDATVKSSDDIRAYYIDIKAEYKYTGKKIKPKVKIKNLKKKYYKVSYKKNKNVGTATITIKGKGKVKGTLKKTFKIVKKN